MDRQLKALVVDDEETYSEAVRLVLEAAGVHVHVANDAYSAETLVRLLMPDLVILDVLVHGMSGLDLIPKLRAIAGWEKVTIVVASAMALKEDRDSALAAGADAYLAKPFGSKDLRAMARRFLPLAKTGALTPAV
jgi:DNA-binding response OmpR family regulator